MSCLGGLASASGCRAPRSRRIPARRRSSSGNRRVPAPCSPRCQRRARRTRLALSWPGTLPGQEGHSASLQSSSTEGDRREHKNHSSVRTTLLLTPSLSLSRILSTQAVVTGQYGEYSLASFRSCVKIHAVVNPLSLTSLVTTTPACPRLQEIRL